MQVHPDGLFLNSIPKSGTVLLNNIIMEFIDHSVKIVQPWMTAATLADERLKDIKNKFFVGHLPVSDRSWLKVKDCRQLLLVRNPRDVCLSYVRFYSSEEMVGRSQLTEFIRARQPDLSMVLRLMLSGWAIAGDRHPPVIAVWKEIARWAHLPNVKIVTYEELMLRLRRIESTAARGFFESILEHGGIRIDDFPDWRDRVLSGAAREKSATFSGGFKYLVPPAGFPSAQDIAMLDFEYHDICAMYERIFLRQDLA